MNQDLLEYNLSNNAYATFDAVSLKELIKDRLTQNSLFTDQNFEGSNLAALADIFAFAYHILLFYYNQTASEAQFDQAELYENMNRIVKTIGYKPSGPRTSALNFEATGDSTMPVGTYNIKRYTQLLVNGIMFSFTKDVSFDKNTIFQENLLSLSQNTLLHQGTYYEYPDYVAIGEDYEIIPIVYERAIDSAGLAGTVEFIDFDNIDVYVYDSETLTWSQWSEVDTLFLSNSIDRVYEKRINENGRYEIKFGNNISGKKINAGDIVSIFYLLSDGKGVGPGAMQQGTAMNLYNTDRFRNLGSVLYPDPNITFITPSNSVMLQFANFNESTPISDYETVESIRQNAPMMFSSQNRAVTINDYKAHITSKFNNIFQSIEVVNNERYISEYLKYYYDMGLISPYDNDRVLLSHLLFADSCDFNNVYVFVVSKNNIVVGQTDPIFTPSSQKTAIKTFAENIKMVSNEIVVVDPIYAAFDLGVEIAGIDIAVDNVRSRSFLEIKVDKTSRLARSKIKDTVNNIIVEYFNTKNCSLGQSIDLTDLSRQILNIDTVDEISTVYIDRANNRYKTPGLSFVYWNPLYPTTDINITNQNIKLPFYKFPYLYNASNLINKISIIE
jgi:hypothetical protein